MVRNSFRNGLVWGMVLSLLFLFVACAKEETPEERKLNPDEEKFMSFVKEHEQKVKPLYKKVNEAEWKANASGKDADFDKLTALNLDYEKIYANKEDFTYLKDLRHSAQVMDPLLKRQLDLLYLQYLGNQFDEKLMEEIVNKQTEINKKFNTFRAEIDGKKYTDNEIVEILQKETDSQKRKEAWEASKAIGPLVAEDIRELVTLRNKAARSVGGMNYFRLSLKLAELEESKLMMLFGELKRLTDEPFRKAKEEMDQILADRYGIKPEDLRPWHYEDRFFQEAPQIYDVDLDKYYNDKDVVDLTKKFFDGIGLPVDDVLDRSDLYEREGKYQHAFCIHVDREGDVRVMANVRPNTSWMDTMLHECGHAVYDKYLDMTQPWLLHEPAHSFTTEAIAMLFGRMARNPFWMEKMLGISKEEREQITPNVEKMARLQQLVFCRWCLVMFQFERILYESTDTDPNLAWYDLVEKMQFLTPPEDRTEPDWATKIHIALYPVYYHNYMLGELMASQLHFTISNDVVKDSSPAMEYYAGKPAVGKFLKKKVFSPGRAQPWKKLIKNATGLELDPKFFAAQFVGITGEEGEKKKE